MCVYKWIRMIMRHMIRTWKKNMKKFHMSFFQASFLYIYFSSPVSIYFLRWALAYTNSRAHDYSYPFSRMLYMCVCECKWTTGFYFRQRKWALRLHQMSNRDFYCSNNYGYYNKMNDWKTLSIIIHTYIHILRYINISKKISIWRSIFGEAIQ